MGDEIIIHDIDRTLDLGKRKLDNIVTRQITINFSKYIVRNRIFKVKRKLIGKNVSIMEILTKRRIIEVKKLREMYDFKNAWLHDGNSLFLDVNNRNKVKVFYH